MTAKTDTPKMDPGSKREALRRKVAESEASLARPKVPERDPPEGLRALVMDYPFAVLMGGLAVGVIAGSLLPRHAARRFGKGTAAAAAVVGELAMLYGQKALEATGKAAEDSRERLSDLGGTVSDGVMSYSEKAADVLSDARKVAAGAARDTAETARDSSLRLARKAINLASHLRH